MQSVYRQEQASNGLQKGRVWCAVLTISPRGPRSPLGPISPIRPCMLIDSTATHVYRIIIT